MSEVEMSKRPPMVAEVIDQSAGVYSQYDLYQDIKAAIETIVDGTTPDSSEETTYSATEEIFLFRNLASPGARIRCTKKNGSWDPTRWDRRSYEVQFDPILDEYQNHGMPIAYIGFLLDDELHTADLFRNSATKHLPHIEYRRIGSPILLEEPLEQVDSNANGETIEALVHEVAAYMLSQGAHGKEEFRATRGADTLKLAFSLASELREIDHKDGLSERWQDRLVAILDAKESLSKADEITKPRETTIGQLTVTIDDKGISASIAGSPDTSPFLGYRLSKNETGAYSLESLGILNAYPVNDMDALLLEQLLRLHTTDWIPFTRAD